MALTRLHLPAAHSAAQVHELGRLRAGLPSDDAIVMIVW